MGTSQCGLIKVMLANLGCAFKYSLTKALRGWVRFGGMLGLEEGAD